MPVEFKDYYQTLGVNRSASEAEIKQAFRALARRYHPDVARDKRTAEARFKEINEAYDVLSDPEKRRKYDELGAHWQDYETAGGTPPRYRPAPETFGHRAHSWSDDERGPAHEFHFGGTTGFSDFFEQFFGERDERASFGGGPFYARDRRSASGRRGADTETDLLVTLAEAFHGAVRLLRLERIDPRTGEAVTETLKVRIPAGVHEGQRVRVPGHGETGTHGGAAGDLYLHIRLAAHPDFRVQGDDVYYDLPLAPWEAVLGTSVEVPTPRGQRARLRIPPGTANAQKLRIQAHGLPCSTGGHGDSLCGRLHRGAGSGLRGRAPALGKTRPHLRLFAPRRNLTVTDRRVNRFPRARLSARTRGSPAFRHHGVPQCAAARQTPAVCRFPTYR